MMTNIKITNWVSLLIKKYESKDSIDPSKKSPSAAAKIETSTFEYIAAVPIVSTKAPVFLSAQVPASLSSIYTPGKPSPISAVTVVEKRAPVDIVTRRPTEKGK